MLPFFRIKKTVFILLLLILILGAGLRIYNLGRFSLWFDEALGVLQAEHVEEMQFKNLIPPLYIYFLHFWSKLADSEFTLRFPSAVFGVVAILMMFIVGRMLFTEKIGLISAFLLALSPFNIYYSQEARCYSLMTVFTLSSFYFLIKALRDDKALSRIGFIVFNLLNIYCHYIGVFFWIAQVIYISAVVKSAGRRKLIPLIICNIIIFLGSFPWLAMNYNFARQADNMYSYTDFWVPGLFSWKSLLMTFKNFTVGFNITRTFYIPIMCFFVFLSIMGIIRFRRKNETGLCLLGLSIPILSIFTVSHFRGLYVDRYFISSSLFYIFIIAAGLSVFNNKRLFLSLLFITLITGIAIKNHYNNFFPYPDIGHRWVQRKKDHRGMAKYISERFRRGDSVYHTCANTISPFIYYSDRLNSEIAKVKDRNIFLKFSKQIDEPKVLEVDLYARDFDKTNTLLDSFKDKKRFWLIVSYWNFEVKKDEYLRNNSLFKWLGKDFRFIEYREFEGGRVYLYERHS